jgi:hypothetical protein
MAADLIQEISAKSAAFLLKNSNILRLQRDPIRPKEAIYKRRVRIGIYTHSPKGILL